MKRKHFFIFLGSIMLLMTLLLVINCGGGKVSIPASWDGEYTLKEIPGVKTISIHDGKIFSIAGETEIELFPAKYPESGYKMKATESEVKAEYNNLFVKFSFDNKKLTLESTGGTKIEYILASDETAETEATTDAKTTTEATETTTTETTTK